MIDSALFMCDVPAATYSVGDVLPLNLKAGSAVVRSGYGAAKLKQIMNGQLIEVSGSDARFEIVVENSNFIDPIINAPSALYGVTGLSEQSTGVQLGNDCDLEINSTWKVYAKCVFGATNTAANSLYCLIDVDYPQVAAVANPLTVEGIPTSIEEAFAVVVDALGGSAAATWDVYNVDDLKPAYKYLLTKISITPQGTNAAFVGFVGMANAAAMQGLSRIIPVTSTPAAIAKKITYAETLTKGPMDVRFMLFATTATTDTVNLIKDYVKKRQ